MRSRGNYTLLHVAAIVNSTSCIRVLLRFAPHHLEAVDWLTETPLMKAVFKNRGDAAKMLMREGADVRAKNNVDKTVFDLARNENHGDMLKILNQHQEASGIF